MNNIINLDIKERKVGEIHLQTFSKYYYLLLNYFYITLSVKSWLFMSDKMFFIILEKIIWSLDAIFWKKGHLNSINMKQEQRKELENKRTHTNYDFAEEMDNITGHIEYGQNYSNDQAYVLVKEDKTNYDINGDKSEKDVIDAELLIKLENKDQINKEFETILKDGQPINNINIKTYEMEDELFNDLGKRLFILIRNMMIFKNFKQKCIMNGLK